ncbi:MAG: hypothetical protein ACYSYU_00170 [Planctomycetota bacterium]|jgi:hypothetical protein
MTRIDEMSQLNQGEKLSVWIYRNLLASGVIIACTFFLYGEIKKIDDKISDVKTQSKANEHVLAVYLSHFGDREAYHSYSMALEPGAPAPPSEVDAEEFKDVTKTIKDFIYEHDKKQRQQFNPAIQQSPSVQQWSTGQLP